MCAAYRIFATSSILALLDMHLDSLTFVQENVHVYLHDNTAMEYRQYEQTHQIKDIILKEDPTKVNAKRIIQEFDIMDTSWELLRLSMVPIGEIDSPHW